MEIARSAKPSREAASDADQFPVLRSTETNENSPLGGIWGGVGLLRALTGAAAPARIWKQWGWQVIERDGFTKPNRFGYAPDGYVLQIEARPDPKYPPSLVGSSP